MKSSKPFEVVRASAGSGKTYRLVSRYLACCLVHDEPRSFRHVLALTFTNKAAWEMKERILKDLAQVGGGTASEDFVQELLDQTQLTADTLAVRARALRATMLHRYGEMAVMTLDSFTNRLVKSFARDLALDQDYRIELDQDRIVEEAVANVLDRVGEPGHEEFTAMLKGFARLQVEEEKDSRIRHPLTTYGKEVLKEGMRDALGALQDLKPEDFRKMSAQLRKDVRREEKTLRALAKLALDKVQAEGLTPKDVSRGSLLTWLNHQSHGEAKAPSPTLSNMFDDGIFTTQKAPTAVVDAVERVRPLAEDVLEQVKRMVPGTPLGEAHTLRKRLMHKMDLVGTLAAISDEMEQVQESRNVRTFHALHERVSRVVRHNPVPFLFERMGSRFRHVFVDEFQDTSITQWQNLIPLVDHVLSERHRTLVVGDGKQAIYRWRNGDYRQLMELPAIVDDEEGAFSDAARTFRDTLDPQVLTSNWRSGRAIVDWNNRFFDAVQARLPLGLQKVYDDHAQTPMKDFEGQVHVQAIAEKDKATREDMVHGAIVERLRHHASKAGGGFSWSDMAILVRTNKQGARIAQHLLNEGITPQTEDSLHVGRHPGALAVVALTRWVVDPTEERHATAWLQCVAALEPERIDESAVLDAFVWQNGADLEHRSFRAAEMMTHLYPALDPLARANGPLVSWIGHACEVLGVTQRFDAYAEALMEMAREVTGTEDSGLRGFLRTWDRVGHSRSIVASGGRDAVQVMTVHKAKGLAFPVTLLLAGVNKAREVKGHLPVVIDPSTGVDVPAALLRVSDMKDTALDPRAEAELDAALLDQINIVYVGMTRPVARLDVLAETPDLAFDRNDPALVGQWVLACAEDMSGKVFTSSGDAVTEGANDGAPSDDDGPLDEAKPMVQTTGLVLGEQVSQRVVLGPNHHALVQPDGLDESALGTVVHDLLAEVKTASDWAQVKQRFERRWTLSEADKAKVVAWAEEVFSNPGSAAFFAEGLHVECEPEWSDGSKAVRPDRVVHDGTLWHVVDFKSGEVSKSEHIQQVQGYMEVLSSLESEPVKGWILYLDPWRLLPVPQRQEPLIFDNV